MLKVTIQILAHDFRDLEYALDEMHMELGETYEYRKIGQTCDSFWKSTEVVDTEKGGVMVNRVFDRLLDAPEYARPLGAPNSIHLHYEINRV